MPTWMYAAAFAAVAPAAWGQAPPRDPAMAGIAFLQGNWSSGRGVVSDSGQTSTGWSHFEPAANGAVLLRQDHTDLFGKDGKKAGGFDQIMLIYPEAGTLRADYADGAHIIHYRSAEFVPGKSVVFSTAAAPGAPQFRLSYVLTQPDTLSVSFAMAPPGGAGFHPIATGTLTRSH